MEIDAGFRSRFDDKWEEDENGCWIWKSTQATNGYGHFWVDGRNRLAHRWSYRIYCGEIPEGKYICHTCHVKLCVSPDHLYAGDPIDNIEDAIERGTWENVGSPPGEDHHWAKLTWEDVDKIREMYASGGRSYYDIAEIFDTSPANVGRIVRRENWVDDPREKVE